MESTEDEEMIIIHQQKYGVLARADASASYRVEISAWLVNISSN